MKSNTYLTYQIGDQLFASNSREVRHILDSRYIGALNNVQSDFPVSYENLFILDIHDSLNELSHSQDQSKCLIILESNGLVTKKVGLIVHKIMKLIDEQDLSFIDKPHIGIAPKNHIIIEDFAKTDREIIGIIRVEKIIQYEPVFLTPKLYFQMM